MLRLVAFALVFAVLAQACNLILDNERRTLEAPSLIVDGGDVEGGGPLPVDPGDAGRSGTCDRLPDCAPGATETREQVCGRCYLGRQSRERTCTPECNWSRFGDWTECVEPPETCTPGDREEKMQPCGPCGLGTQVVTRVCADECGWTDWSEEACVPREDTCEPGTMETLAPVACDAMCGKATQTRTCNEECTWDEIVTGPCTGQGVCSPGTTQMQIGNCNANYCNKGEQQQQQTCTRECTWSEPIGIGGCNIPTNVCRPPDLGGVGWRCRPGDPGFRETCRPASSPTEAERCTWRGDREPYPSEC